MIPTLPNGDTIVLKRMMTLANLIEAEVDGKPFAPPGVVFMTAGEWGTLMRELRSALPEGTPEAFFQQQKFLLGRVTFRNAGTDDAETVMLANRLYEEQSGFVWKRTHLRTA